jgi:CTP:molybdopterin cytidylyltransferase MocA
MEQEQTSNLSSSGKRGHPLLIHSNDIEQILASAPETPLRSLIHAQPCDVDAPYLALNIDTPEDLRLLEEAKNALAC